MKKKRSIVILLVVLALVGLYLYRNGAQEPPSETLSAGGVLDTAAGALTLIDGNDADSDANASSAPAADEPSAPTAPESEEAATDAAEADEPTLPAIDEDGAYTQRDDLALYIHTYGRLPDNFITKDEAGRLGWSGGGLDDYAYGMCIGGDRFGNYEGLLPEKNGRRYTECDVGTMHRSSRGAKRIVFSNDGLIYYTDDHYDSFTLLYGEE